MFGGDNMLGWRRSGGSQASAAAGASATADAVEPRSARRLTPRNSQDPSSPGAVVVSFLHL